MCIKEHFGTRGFALLSRIDGQATRQGRDR